MVLSTTLLNWHYRPTLAGSGTIHPQDLELHALLGHGCTSLTDLAVHFMLLSYLSSLGTALSNPHPKVSIWHGSCVLQHRRRGRRREKEKGRRGEVGEGGEEGEEGEGGEEREEGEEGEEGEGEREDEEEEKDQVTTYQSTPPQPPSSNPELEHHHQHHHH
jgi:hypothetical protein